MTDSGQGGRAFTSRSVQARYALACEGGAATVPERETWIRLAQRLRTLWLLKTLTTTGAIAIFFYAYFWVMRHPFFAVTVMPLTWIDEFVPFQPWSFYLYASLWFYISLGTALARDLRELAAFGAASLAMTVVGLGIFMLAPTEIPNFAFDWHQYPSLMFLKTIDVSGNACPSLHAAFAVFTAFAMRSASNLPAAHAVSTLMPSASVTSSHAGRPLLSTSFATLK